MDAGCRDNIGEGLPPCVCSHLARAQLGCLKTHKQSCSPVQISRPDPTTDLYKYSPDAVPPIQYVSSHVASDKDPSK